MQNIGFPAVVPKMDIPNVQRIDIPTLNDGQADYLRLFQVAQRVQLTPFTIVFDFTRCRFLRPGAVAFLGGVARLAQHQGKRVTFDWGTVVDSAVLANLCQSGFAGQFGFPSPAWLGNSIPYRQDKDRAHNSILDYLTDQWIGRGWLNVSELLRDAIVGKVWEIYANSFEHGESPVGVFSCGQRFKNNNELVLSVVDLGTGIPAKVRQFLHSDPRARGLHASSCLSWAFQQGNSTAAQVVPRGLGLDLLREFVSLNDGSLEVYSDTGYALINRQGEQFCDLPFGFSGTAVQIKLRCDERSYRFKNEVALPS